MNIMEDYTKLLIYLLEADRKGYCAGRDWENENIFNIFICGPEVERFYEQKRNFENQKEIAAINGEYQKEIAIINGEYQKEIAIINGEYQIKLKQMEMESYDNSPDIVPIASPNPVPIASPDIVPIAKPIGENASWWDNHDDWQSNFDHFIFEDDYGHDVTC